MSLLSVFATTTYNYSFVLSFAVKGQNDAGFQKRLCPTQGKNPSCEHCMDCMRRTHDITAVFTEVKSKLLSGEQVTLWQLF